MEVIHKTMVQMGSIHPPSTSLLKPRTAQAVITKQIHAKPTLSLYTNSYRLTTFHPRRLVHQRVLQHSSLLGLPQHRNRRTETTMALTRQWASPSLPQSLLQLLSQRQPRSEGRPPLKQEDNHAALELGKLRHPQPDLDPLGEEVQQVSEQAMPRRHNKLSVSPLLLLHLRALHSQHTLWPSLCLHIQT